MSVSGAALRFLMKAGGAARPLPGKATARYWKRNTGLVVLAMGKYGAFELNYSSDIDLVVFYERGENFPSPSAVIPAVRRSISCVAWSS